MGMILLHDIHCNKLYSAKETTTASNGCLCSSFSYGTGLSNLCSIPSIPVLARWFNERSGCPKQCFHDALCPEQCLGNLINSNDILRNAKTLVSTRTKDDNVAPTPEAGASTAPVNHGSRSAAAAVSRSWGLNVRSPIRTSNPSCDSVSPGNSSRSRPRLLGHRGSRANRRSTFPTVSGGANACSICQPGVPSTSNILSSCACRRPP